MKKQYIYSALILAAALFAGCAKEIENTLDGTDGSAIELSSVSTDPMTKAVITGTEFTTTEAEKGIGLFLLDANGKAYGSNLPNVNYYHSGSKWVADKPLRAGGTSGMLYGYYPYSQSVTDITAISVESSIDGTDYLYASPVEVNSSNAKSVSLSLNHALARVSLVFKLDNSYVGSSALSAISLSGDCVAGTGKLNAKTGSINAAAGAFSADGLNRTVDKEAPTIVECLVVPVSIESGTPKLKIACTIDGKAYATTFTGNLAALAQGKQTTIELTVQNTSLSIDGSSIGAWGDGGSQTVTVGGDYKVTIALADGVAAHDVLTEVYVDGNSVIVSAYSKSGQHLKCTMPGGEFCTSQSKTTYKDPTDDTISRFEYTFTISDITENTTATIGYASPVSIAVTPNNSGSVKITGDAYEGETVTLTANPAYEYGFDAWLDKDGDALTCEDETYSNARLSSDGMSVRFKENLILGGEFSVAAGKKVRFTRGNLYCSGAGFNDNGKCTSVTNAQWRLEQRQSDYGGAWDGGTRISHFLWSKDCMRSLDKTYDGTGASGEDVFFTNSGSFTVSGISSSDYKCRTLTTEEWQYLFSYDATKYGGNNYDNDARRGKYKLGVTVCGKGNCIVLLPDNSELKSTDIEDSYDYVGWKHMEAAGAVCLPAAGYRNGDPLNQNPAYVRSVGYYGYYWSASSDGDYDAYDLFFDGFGVKTYYGDARSRAQSVRLVTESK